MFRSMFPAAPFAALLMVSTTFGWAVEASSQDWPQWRGANRENKSA
ncbi:MAG: hypothetical protein QM811_26130 [Pirellulales bacterium]